VAAWPIRYDGKTEGSCAAFWLAAGLTQVAPSDGYPVIKYFTFMKKVSFKACWGKLCRFSTMLELKGFAYERRGNNPDEEEKEPESKSYAPEDLELVCYMTLSGQ
jgi:hypothetical protein